MKNKTYPITQSISANKCVLRVGFLSTRVIIDILQDLQTYGDESGPMAFVIKTPGTSVGPWMIVVLPGYTWTGGGCIGAPWGGGGGYAESVYGGGFWLG